MRVLRGEAVELVARFLEATAADVSGWLCLRQALSAKTRSSFGSLSPCHWPISKHLNKNQRIVALRSDPRSLQTTLQDR